jgi:hypothetical protein
MALKVNMAKARDIHRAKLRHAREPLFKDLDLKIMRAQEAGSDISAIVAKKQALRDVTQHPAIDAAQTIDDLKKVWPTCLER